MNKSAVIPGFCKEIQSSEKSSERCEVTKKALEYFVSKVNRPVLAYCPHGAFELGIPIRGDNRETVGVATFPTRAYKYNDSYMKSVAVFHKEWKVKTDVEYKELTFSEYKKLVLAWNKLKEFTPKNVSEITESLESEIGKQDLEEAIALAEAYRAPLDKGWDIHLHNLRMLAMIDGIKELQGIYGLETILTSASGQNGTNTIRYFFRDVHDVLPSASPLYLFFDNGEIKEKLESVNCDGQLLAVKSVLAQAMQRDIQELTIEPEYHRGIIAPYLFHVDIPQIGSKIPTYIEPNRLTKISGGSNPISVTYNIV